MQTGIRAAREQVAVERINAAAALLADAAGIGESAPSISRVSARDPQVLALFRLEAVADLLDDLVTRIPAGETAGMGDGAVADALADADLPAVKVPFSQPAKKDRS